MKTFLKVSEVQLVNGGYLTSKDGIPVGNAEFISAQKHAEYVVTFAEKAKGKDLVGKKADTVESIRKAVNEALSVKDVQYVAKPKVVKRELTDKLAKEAMSFIDFTEGSSKTEKINEFLQDFNIINDFEEFGLFFEEEIVKLDKIYTMKEIVAAVKEIIDLI